MTISLEHQAVKAHLDQTTRDLGLTLHTEVHEDAGANMRVIHGRTMEVHLPRPVGVRATFSHERLIDYVKKLFKNHPFEAGASVFDARVHVVTSTPDETHALLAHARVQEALLLLVTRTRRVEIADDTVRVIDQDATEAQEDVAAELVALSAHLTPDLSES